MTQPQPTIANSLLFALFQTHMNMIAQGRSISDQTDGHKEAILAEIWVRFGIAAMQHQHPIPAIMTQPQPTIANILLFALYSKPI